MVTEAQGWRMQRELEFICTHCTLKNGQRGNSGYAYLPTIKNIAPFFLGISGTKEAFQSSGICELEAMCAANPYL